MKNLMVLVLCSFALSFSACKSAPKAEEAAAAPTAATEEHNCSECMQKKKSSCPECKDHAKGDHRCTHKADKKSGKCKDCKG